MRLIRLSLNNFKGISFFTLDAQGQDVNAYGDNATGKTTLFDAFTWLMFDKDSTNRKDFEIKTLDSAGQAIHGLNHEVEAVLDIDGQPVTLRKVFSEKWTKKRGSAQPVFTGHTTDYYINGVPVKKTEYEARIASICDENIFKLLTSPTYFNEQLHWQKRREILLEVCGDISDEEVIASDEALAKLPQILSGRKLDEHRKIIVARRAEINKELERIPVRISEVEFNLPNISGIIPDKLPEDIAKLRTERQGKLAELAQLEDGGDVAEKKRRLQEIEAQLLQVKNQYQNAHHEAVRNVRAKLLKAESEASSLQVQVHFLAGELRNKDEAPAKLETHLQKLRENWYAVNSAKFEFVQDTVCPTCGQPLPEEKLNEAREKALADFNRNKAAKLEEINEAGKATKAEYERLKAESHAVEQQINEANEQLKRFEQEINRLRDEVARVETEADSYESDLRYQQMLAEKRTLEEEIAGLRAASTENTIHIKQEIARLDQAIAALEETQAKLKQHEQGLKRIEELKQLERQLAAEYERLEQELYLTEEFIRRKVSLLEDRINNRFGMARFKLFDVQVNGGISECCETMYNGVPYSSLNNGAKINVGLDIIRTLAEHYNFRPPIFIDNREAITKLLDMGDQQVISLIVSEPDKELRVEIEEKKQKEVA